MGLQQPLEVYPTMDETVDATTTVAFTVQIRGTQCIKYTIYIYDVATNTEQYTDTVTLGTTLLDGATLSIDVDMSALGADSYYWCIDLYYGAGVDDYITSNYYTFIASSLPSCVYSPSVPSTVTTPSKELVCAYTQAEGIAVKSFTMVLYDSTYDGVNDAEDHIVATSGLNITSPNNIRYTFNGLISGQSYQTQTTGLTQGDVAFATTLDAFNVSYVVPSSLVHPTATMNENTSVTIDISKIVSIVGTTSGSVSYEPNFLYTGNYGLNLATGAYVRFALDFSAPFTKPFIYQFPVGFTGNFAEVKDTAGTSYIYFGYDGARFYLNINGDYYYAANEVLATNPYYLAIIHDGVTISLYTREVV
jgi:hypothetical protein